MWGWVDPLTPRKLLITLSPHSRKMEMAPHLALPPPLKLMAQAEGQGAASLCVCPSSISPCRTQMPPTHPPTHPRHHRTGRGGGHRRAGQNLEASRWPGKGRAAGRAGAAPRVCVGGFPPSGGSLLQLIPLPSLQLETHRAFAACLCIWRFLLSSPWGP